MRKLLDYISKFGKWIWESYEITIVLIPIILIVSFRAELGAEKIALCGGIMQVAGALYGILIYIDLMKYFSEPSLWALFEAWRERFPRLRKDVRVLAGASNLSISLISGKVSIWTPDDSFVSVEERIKRIIRNQDELRKSLEDAESTISSLRIELTSKIESQEGNFQSEIKEVKSTLESIHMEDFLWALTGLLFILAGTLFTNFASYIA
jgi:hypothetical protein